MPLEVGKPITILHDYSTKQKRLERNIHISSGKQLILATSHFDDASVPRSADRAELLCQTLPGGQVHFYWSDPLDDDREQPLKEVPQIAPAVSIKSQAESGLVFVDKAQKGVSTYQAGRR